MEASSPILTLAAIGAIQLLAVISPGPAFLMVSRAAATKSRSHGFATGLGVAAAAVMWAIAASLGLDLLLDRFPWLYRALQIGGGSYLVWIGWMSVRHAADPLPMGGESDPSSGLLSAWTTGLKAGLANPKIIVFFGSIFVTLLQPGSPDWMKAGAVAIVAFNETSWYAGVAFIFSIPAVQRAYRRAKAWIERGVGSLLGLFGARMVIGGLSG
jgi:threonine efflux protein